jgi:hypothetical protein
MSAKMALASMFGMADEFAYTGQSVNMLDRQHKGEE